MDRTGLSFLLVGPGRGTRRCRLADEKPHAARAHREPRAGPLGRFRYRSAACRRRLARQRRHPESPGAGVISRARPQDAGRAIATRTRRQSLGGERYLPGMAGRCGPLARRSARTGADGRGSRPRSGFRSSRPLRGRPSRARWRRARVHRARCGRARVDDSRLGRRTIGDRSQPSDRAGSRTVVADGRIQIEGGIDFGLPRNGHCSLPSNRLRRAAPPGNPRWRSRSHLIRSPYSSASRCRTHRSRTASPSSQFQPPRHPRAGHRKSRRRSRLRPPRTRSSSTTSRCRLAIPGAETCAPATSSS